MLLNSLFSLWKLDKISFQVYPIAAALGCLSSAESVYWKHYCCAECLWNSEFVLKLYIWASIPSPPAGWRWPLIGWEWSRDLDTGLWLAGAGWRCKQFEFSSDLAREFARKEEVIMSKCWRILKYIGTLRPGLSRTCKYQITQEGDSRLRGEYSAKTK